MEYQGVDDLDPHERKRQHLLTESLWENLTESGITSGMKGCVSGYFFAPNLEIAEGLLAPYVEDGEWKCRYTESKNEYIVEITSSLSYLSLEMLIELADVFMVSALEVDARFDGFELKTSEILELNRKKRWKFW